MNAQTRIRLIWATAAATAAYALATVLVYYTTGSFNGAWLATSLIVYALLIAVSLALAWKDTDAAEEETSEAESEDAEEAESDEEPSETTHDVVYQTQSGEVVRSAAATPRGPRTEYVAAAGAEARDLREIEADLDEREAVQAPEDLEDRVDKAVRTRQVDPETPPRKSGRRRPAPT